MEYSAFLDGKRHEGAEYGFDPVWLPDELFPFQADLVTWALQKGRSAIFADCGLGKTFMQLAWAENVARHASGRVLVLAPLAVGFQTVIEGQKIGVDIAHRQTGVLPADRLVVTNYERLDRFDPADFVGVVCDESSILKGFDGSTRAAVTDFMRKLPYRLLCTATAAPNDFIELGTSSEALGELGLADMLSRFFKKTEKTFSRSQEFRQGLYRFRGHAEQHFWRWVVSWARAMRRPSDLGYDNDGFLLPPLSINQHEVTPRKVRPGLLFDLPAIGLQEEREDLRRTIDERCEMVATLINAHDRPAIAWCNLNDEGAKLTRLILGAVEVSGSDPVDQKEAALLAFMRGDVRVLVTKPTIAGFGLNFQHCAHVCYFPSHSYEQYYQSVRRCWRFGQRSPVQVDLVTTTGQTSVLENLQRKAAQADSMFEQLTALMRQELTVRRQNDYTSEERVPAWL